MQSSPRLVDRFIRALELIESSPDGESVLTPMLELFDEGGELSNSVHPEPLRGKEGVTRFWREYRKSFKEVKSVFSRVDEKQGLAVLEWTSSGQLKTGKPFRYRGVSLLDERDGRILSFRDYYDSMDLAA